MTDVYEDSVLSDIFACTLDAVRASTDATPPVVHLENLAQVLTHHQYASINEQENL